MNASAGGVLLPELSDRVDELQREVDELRDAPQNTIGSVNETIINSKGEVEKPEQEALGLDEYLDTFEAAGMPNWLQSPKLIRYIPFLDLWTPTPGEGLKLTNVKHFTKNQLALLTNPDYYEGEVDITKPLLGPYMAVLHFSMGPTLKLPLPLNKQTALYGLRVIDTSNWPLAPNNVMPGSAKEFLNIQASLRGVEAGNTALILTAGGYAAGIKEKLNFYAGGLEFWLIATVYPVLGGDQWEFQLWNFSPLKWSAGTEGGSNEPLLNVQFKTIGIAHRVRALGHLRLAMEVSTDLESEYLPEELGARIRSLRIIPLLDNAYPNF